MGMVPNVDGDHDEGNTENRSTSEKALGGSCLLTKLVCLGSKWKCNVSNNYEEGDDDDHADNGDYERYVFMGFWMGGQEQEA